MAMKSSAANDEATKRQSTTTNGRPRVFPDVGAAVVGRRALERCIKCTSLDYIIFLLAKSSAYLIIN